MGTLIPSIPVIGVTGSAGKTTTKEMIASILGRRYKIFKSIGNMNGRYHTRSYVQKIKPQHQAAVLEMGMGKIGSGRAHCSFIQPNIGVITSIGTAHLGNFGGEISKVAKAKSELIQYMKQDGLVVINKDDPNSKRIEYGGFKGKVITVGVKAKAEVQAKQVHYGERGMIFQAILKGKMHTFHIPAYGEHNVINALLALAVADHLGFTPQEIKKGLALYRKPFRRLIVKRLPRKIILIDDSYNSNPHAVMAALDVLVNLGGRKKIAVLGSMKELGKKSEHWHKEVGRFLAKKQIDACFTFGNEARWIGEGAVEAGYPIRRVFHYLDRNRMHRDLFRQISPGTTIVVKGSHSMRMNKTVSVLYSILRKKGK